MARYGADGLDSDGFDGFGNRWTEDGLWKRHPDGSVTWHPRIRAVSVAMAQSGIPFSPIRLPAWLDDTTVCVSKE